MLSERILDGGHVQYLIRVCFIVSVSCRTSHTKRPLPIFRSAADVT